MVAKGGNSGFNSANLQILPGERVVIAMITSGDTSADGLTKPILEGLLQDRHLSVPNRLNRPPPAQRIAATLDRYQGYYAMEPGVLKISMDKARRKLNLAPLGRDNIPPLALDYEGGYFHGPAATGGITSPPCRERTWWC